jgi:CheY-like chemotaxis protein/phosphoribosyl 1,2-cyclic phosphodiesterase
LVLRFWGTRGSIATPGPATTRYGGNTSCVEVVLQSGQRFIFDCGTGIRLLGGELLAHAPKPIAANLLISHSHWDHIQGFPFFAPAFIPGSRFRICGPDAAYQSLPSVLAGQMEYTYFPVELGQLGAEITYQGLGEGTVEMDGARITCQFLNHPAVTLGYRIEADGVALMYVCDHEPFWEPLWKTDAEPGRRESILHAGDLRHAAFLENADVVIHDAQYTPEEYPSKKNWGHSTYTYATQIAAVANVKRLYLTHHDPTHSDDFLSQMEQRAQALAASLGSSLRVTCAREGYEKTLEGSGQAAHAVTGTFRIPARQQRILIIDDDEDLRILVRKTLERGGYEVLEAVGGGEGIEMIQSQSPDLVLLDLVMPPPDGIEVLRTLRLHERSDRPYIVVLTAKGDEDSARACFDLGATDFLNKPFTPPQLDARIRSCFARGPVSAQS